MEKRLLLIAYLGYRAAKCCSFISCANILRRLLPKMRSSVTIEGDAISIVSNLCTAMDKTQICYFCISLNIFIGDMGTNRDNFTIKTVDILAKRVGYLCSNPDCRKHTVGPNTNVDKATIVGVAAHITAASPNGPRYDHTLDKKDRVSIENGIWLCVNCSTLIDKDEKAFDKKLLLTWKTNAEQHMSDSLKGIVKQTPANKKVAYLEADLIYSGAVRINRGYSTKNRDIYGDEPILVGSPMIIHWDIRWDLSLVIYNNSQYPAYNLKLETADGTLQYEPLSKINNLPAFANIEIDARHREHFEGDHIGADELMNQKIPSSIIGQQYRLSYTDDTRTSHTLNFSITEEGIVNEH